MIPCSCGKTEPHVIAEARTLDGVRLERWSTGEITGALGVFPRGLGPVRNHDSERRATELVWPDISLYEWREITALVKTARRALSQKSFPPITFIRRSMAGESFKKIGAVVTSTKRIP